jgi:hypothetical protein
MNLPVSSPRIIAQRLLAEGIQPQDVAMALRIYRSMQCDGPVNVVVGR